MLAFSTKHSGASVLFWLCVKSVVFLLFDNVVGEITELAQPACCRFDHFDEIAGLSVYRELQLTNQLH